MVGPVERNDLSESFSRASRLQEYRTPDGHAIMASSQTVKDYGIENLGKIADGAGRHVLFAAPGDFSGPDDITPLALHPEYFPHKSREGVFLENASDFGKDAREGSPSAHRWSGSNGERTGTIALDKPGRDPKEIFAGMAGLNPAYVGKVPGDARSWGAYTVKHEGEHLRQDSSMGELEGEAGADRAADKSYAQALKNGENLDPAVPDAWKGARAIGVIRNTRDLVTALKGDVTSGQDLFVIEANEAANSGYNVTPFVKNPDMPFSDKNIRETTAGAVRARTAVNIVLGTAYGEDYIEKNGGLVEIGDRDITKEDIAGTSQGSMENRILVGGRIGKERPDLQYGAAKTALDEGFFERRIDDPADKYAKQALEDYTAAAKTYAPMVANDKVAAQVEQDYDTASKAIFQPTDPAPAPQQKPGDEMKASAPAPAPAPAPSF